MQDSIPRKTVYEAYDLSDYKYANINHVIEQLTKLRDEGYTKVDIEVESAGCGEYTSVFNATRVRPETDQEYDSRIKSLELDRERRRQQYLRLKEEFGGVEGQ